MSEQNPSLFRTPEEELAHLGRQLADIREALKEISARVSQIERHVKRAFAVSSLPGGSPPRTPKPRTEPDGPPSFPPEQARPIFEELVQLWRESSPGAARTRLEAMSAPDLNLLAHELGLSFPKKPSRKALISALIGRINESILLSRNANRESLAEATSLEQQAEAHHEPHSERAPRVMEEEDRVGGVEQNSHASPSFSDLTPEESQTATTPSPANHEGSLGETPGSETA